MAHELAHALQDQTLDLAAQQRRGLEDWDYDFLHNCVIEGLAYQTMMAVAAGTSLAAAPDPTPMLTASLEQLDTLPAYSAYADAPPYLREGLLGRALDGIAFVRAWLARHPDATASSLLERLPASGEQVLHPHKYEEADAPAAIDLRLLDERVPRDWRPYLENTLGEFEVRMMLRPRSGPEDSANAVAEGWDGCRFRAYEDEDGRLFVLGVSRWDSDRDADELVAALRRWAEAESGRLAAAGRGSTVRFAFAPEGEEADRLLAILDDVPSAD
jgi:hypothetical protein